MTRLATLAMTLTPSPVTCLINGQVVVNAVGGWEEMYILFLHQQEHCQAIRFQIYQQDLTQLLLRMLEVAL